MAEWMVKNGKCRKFRCPSFKGRLPTCLLIRPSAGQRFCLPCTSIILESLFPVLRSCLPQLSLILVCQTCSHSVQIQQSCHLFPSPRGLHGLHCLSLPLY